MYLRKPHSTIGLLTAKQGYKDEGLQNRNFFNPQEFLNEWYQNLKPNLTSRNLKLVTIRIAGAFILACALKGKKGGIRNIIKYRS